MSVVDGISREVPRDTIRRVIRLEIFSQCGEKVNAAVSKTAGE